jgi:hypothetical protein
LDKTAFAKWRRRPVAVRVGIHLLANSEFITTGAEEQGDLANQEIQNDFTLIFRNIKMEK